MKNVMYFFFLVFVACGSYWIFIGLGTLLEGYIFGQVGLGWPSYAESVPYLLVAGICFGISAICLYLAGH